MRYERAAAGSAVSKSQGKQREETPSQAPSIALLQFRVLCAPHDPFHGMNVGV